MFASHKLLTQIQRMMDCLAAIAAANCPESPKVFKLVHILTRESNIIASFRFLNFQAVWNLANKYG